MTLLQNPYFNGLNCFILGDHEIQNSRIPEFKNPESKIQNSKIPESQNPAYSDHLVAVIYT